MKRKLLSVMTLAILSCLFLVASCSNGSKSEPENEGIVNFYIFDGKDYTKVKKYILPNEPFEAPEVEGYTKNGKEYVFLYWSKEKDAKPREIGNKKFDFENGFTEETTDLYAIYAADLQFEVKSEDCKAFVSWNGNEYEYSLTIYPTDDMSSKFTQTVTGRKKTNYEINGLENFTEYTVEISGSQEDEFSVKTVTPKPIIKKSDYLMIMYMDGDNNLNDVIYMDLNEVEYGLHNLRNNDPNASVNVVALWDGFAGDSNTTPQFGTSKSVIYEIGEDTGCEINYTNSLGWVLSEDTKDLSYTASWLSDGEVNMGDKQTLINFLNWVNERYEADNVILQFSNHGGGPRSAPVYAKTEDGFTVKLNNQGRRALCWDDGSSSDIFTCFLTTRDISDALKEAGYGKSNQIDMILMDVCLGASIEDAYQFKDYAKYLVGSPNTIPGYGMNYIKMMESFTKNSTIESVGKQLIDDYREFYTWPEETWAALNNAYENDNMYWYSMAGISTLSMIDLSKMDALEDSITALAKFIVDNPYKLDTKTDENGNNVDVYYTDLLKENFIRFSGVNGTSIYYQGTFSWLFDIGYMIDNFKYISTSEKIDTQQGEIDNPYKWPGLAEKCDPVIENLNSAIVKAWRDAPVGENLYDYLCETKHHYGLTISGETIVISGDQLYVGTCPNFYRTDLDFGRDSAWTDLLVVLFGEEFEAKNNN